MVTKAPVRRVVKKRTVVKPTGSATGPAKKTVPAKKVAAPAKRTVKKTTDAPKERRTVNRDFTPHGFVRGTDSAIIADLLVAGGESRLAVNEAVQQAVEAANGGSTRGGVEKNWPSLVSNVIRRLVAEKGYEIESSYRLVPPPEIAQELKAEATAAKRAATRASKPGVIVKRRRKPAATDDDS